VRPNTLACSRNSRAQTDVLDRVPQAFGVFAHPEVAAGEPMQVTALSIDERQRRVRLDLIDHREPPSG
jgi:hypothetical protein